MYTDMEQWTEIRRLVFVEGKSKRSVCRQFGVHWDTLNKILEYSEPPGYRLSKPRSKRKIGPYLEIIDQILQQDKKVHRKQRHTKHRIFKRLRDEYGYTGGCTAVKEVLREREQRGREVFMPLIHPPGEAQVDFGFADIILDGQTTKVALFVMTLLYSDAVFCCVFPRECTETFMEGHRRAFEFFGAVPKRISYDNSKIPVANIVGKRERQLTDAFLKLKSHFLFDSHFCLVRRPNEKGQVECLVGFTRRNFLVPLPRVDAFDSLNAELEQKCRADLDRRLRGKTTTKAQRLEEERPAMLDLPRQSYEARRIEQGRSDSLSLVRFDRNSYSVPVTYAHRPITVVAGIDEVRLVADNHLVARHRRHWGKEHTQYDPIHYLALLERKPGALDFARPLDGWALPGCFDLLRRRLEAQLDHKGTREYIKVLRLLEKASMGELAEAIQQTLVIGAISYDAVRVILQNRQEQPVGLFCLDGRPHLKLDTVQSPDLSAYHALVAGGAS
jgi:transposase